MIIDLEKKLEERKIEKRQEFLDNIMAARESIAKNMEWLRQGDDSEFTGFITASYKNYVLHNVQKVLNNMDKEIEGGLPEDLKELVITYILGEDE